MSDWELLIQTLIERSKAMNAAKTSVTYSKCGDVESSPYSGWDIRVTVAKPGTLEPEESDE